MLQEDLVIARDDPLAPDVRALLERHLALMHEVTPPEDVHALDPATLAEPGVAFFSVRSAGRLLGVAALKDLEPGHAEIKSMHTVAEARGRGVARALLDHLMALARERGLRRVSLETGAQDAFAPARTLYARAGFVPAGPFGGYPDSPGSAYFTLVLDPAG